MLDALLWPPIFIPLALSVAMCFSAGFSFSRAWVGLLIAEIFSILGLAFLHLLNGSHINDKASLSSFLIDGYFSPAHILAFAFFSALVLAGVATRRLLTPQSQNQARSN